MSALPEFAFENAASMLNDRDFATVRQLIAEYAGIKLSLQKRNMVYNRLLRRLRARGVGTFGDYLAIVQREGSDEREAFVNALTTNLTAFFREPHHFDLLHAHAAKHAKRGRPLRCWSSACSTGEEAWSIAMVLREAECPGDVLGTDIDTDVLNTARSGIYRMERAAPLPAERLRRHFLRGAGANEGLVSVRPELRSMVRFGQLNLQSPAWPAQEPFDVIFCRNVVIYFDREFQKQLLARLAGLLVPGGLLMVGHSESFPAAHPGFRSCGRTAYERVGA
ncbi:chemotaxis protein CheR [Ramlibacter sp. USB13]|uniref:Chemotaxis protein methyltransferase n=1 Tax=Ramlibacter cellulosilyticus TaxID=2764187 RepID=A0A923MRE8_9BURK|nr:CheR family methyltransferase [Ramlibacter cellulosilyticus]MBC5782452.1 chemotaxis protein CheR [Ramlibacter cellulosilyticus]